MELKCETCGISFCRSLSQSRRSGKHYCSRSCAAKTNNLIPRRKRTKICATCQNTILSDRKYCRECLSEKKTRNTSETIGDIVSRSKNKASAFSIIRTRARKIAQEQGWCKCSRCPYDKHIEIAHIKPLIEYDMDTLVSEVNIISNLLPLCPNCHWEQDNL